MKTFIMKIALCLAVLGMSQTVSAQGFLKKLKQSAEQTLVTKSDEGSKETTDSVADKLKESDFPAYTMKKFYETDENGNRLKNEDGTDKYRVFLVDKEGNKVSAEVVAAQSKQINEAIISIAAKVATSAGVGALTGKGKGALIGVAVGLGLSVNDIMLVVKLKKNAMKQKKALELYQKTFDENGNPIAANVDPKTLKDLDITDKNSTSESTEKIKQDMASAGYTTIASNESLDALLAAATKL